MKKSAKHKMYTEIDYRDYPIYFIYKYINLENYKEYEKEFYKK